MSYHSHLATRIRTPVRRSRRPRGSLPRKLPKQARAQDTVEAILGATAHILEREGMAAASTNRVAERAGVSIGSVYQYFPNKEALVAALVDRHVRQIQAVVEHGLGTWRALPLRAAVRAMVRAMLDAHAVAPRLHRVLSEEMPHTASFARLEDVEGQFVALARAWLEQHRAEVRPRNLELAAFVIVQATEALTHGAALHHPEHLADDELLDEVTELLVRYLDGGRRRPP
jgi:AcrR family transcriptional regulator